MDMTPHTTITLDYPGDELISGSLHMSLAYGRNHAAPEVEAENLAWLAELGLLTRGSAAELAFRAGRYPELARHVYRREDRVALRIAVDFITSLFFFDDLLDTNQSHVGADSALVEQAAKLLAASARSGAAPSSSALADWPLTRSERQKLLGVAAALANITTRLEQRGGVSPEPFLAAVEAWLGSMAREAAHRSGRPYASLADYASIRTSYSAVYPCIELGLALRGVAPSAETRRDEHFQRAMEAANLLVAYINDLFSYKREARFGERTNLVMVLEDVHGSSRAAAFPEACRIINGVMSQFLRSRALLEASGHDAREAAEMFESWARGNYDWHVDHTQRYRQALSTYAPSSSVEF
jgi:hypothetical protein